MSEEEEGTTKLLLTSSSYARILYIWRRVLAPEDGQLPEANNQQTQEATKNFERQSTTYDTDTWTSHRHTIPNNLNQSPITKILEKDAEARHETRTLGVGRTR